MVMMDESVKSESLHIRDFRFAFITAWNDETERRVHLNAESIVPLCDPESQSPWRPCPYKRIVCRKCLALAERRAFRKG